MKMKLFFLFLVLFQVFQIPVFALEEVLEEPIIGGIIQDNELEDAKIEKENDENLLSILYSDVQENGLDKIVSDYIKTLYPDLKFEIEYEGNYPKVVSVKFSDDSNYTLNIQYQGICIKEQKVELSLSPSDYYEIVVDNMEQLEEEGYSEEDILVTVSDSLLLDGMKVFGKKEGTGKITIQTSDFKYHLVLPVTIRDIKIEVPSDSTVEAGEKSVEQKPSILYRTHIENIGWEKDFIKDGETSGTSHQSKRLEAIQIKLDTTLKGGIEYRTHVQSIGWEKSFVKDGETSGTSHQSKRLEAIQIRLYGDVADKYDVYYRVHAQNIGWMSWAKNGESAGTAGYSYRLEAIQIVLLEKGVEPTIPTDTKTIYSYKQPQLSYQTHVQNIGWQNRVVDGVIAGTSGKSLRLESISIQLMNPEYTGDILYRSYVQDYGWLGWKKNGEISGTSGESKRMEAIQVKLTGEISNHYDVYYRVHAQNFGWMAWAKNGESAGTAHHSCRLEAIEILLVEKGNSPPARGDVKTNVSFVESSGWQIIDGKKYYIYQDGTSAKYISKINGRRYEFTGNGELQYENIKLIIDVSKYNGNIDWDKVWNSGEIDGVILRISAGAGFSQLDPYFEKNLQAMKRLNIPYGVYIYSYAENYDEGVFYGNFTNQVLRKFEGNPSLGIYFDLEENGIVAHLSTEEWEQVVKGYMGVCPSAKIYTYTNFLETKLNTSYLRSLTTWIANYAVTDRPGDFRGWQYTSKGKVTGINGDVDISIFYY